MVAEDDLGSGGESGVNVERVPRLQGGHTVKSLRELIYIVRGETSGPYKV